MVRLGRSLDPWRATSAGGGGCRTKYRNRQTFDSCTNSHPTNGPNEQSDGPVVAEFDEAVAVVAAVVGVAAAVAAAEGYKGQCRWVGRPQCDSSTELPGSWRPLRRVRRPHGRPDDDPWH